MKIAGFIIVDGQEVAETAQCCHCGFHWIVRHGSGAVRGFCLKCDARTCGSAKCHDCMPLEKKLDLYEKGKISTL